MNPHPLLFTLTLLGLTTAAVLPGWLAALLAALCAGGVLWAARTRETAS